MPKSALHFSAISLMFDTPVPNWRSVMFLVVCAQSVGKPVTTPLPSAAPAMPAAPLSILRRAITALGPPLNLRAISVLLQLVTSMSEDMDVLGSPRQNHRLAGPHRRGVEARLGH